MYPRQRGMVHTSVGCQQLRQVRPIGMGVSIAALGDTVLVDCTGTAKSPYSCRPVIYSNKSLSILDYKSEVHIKCGESKKKIHSTQQMRDILR